MLNTESQLCFNSKLLLMCAVRVSSGSSNIWAPATLLGNTGGNYVSWLQPSPALPSLRVCGE